MKKRLLVGILAAVMLLSMAACSAPAAQPTDAGTTTQTSSTDPATTTVTPQKVTLYPYSAALQSGPASGWVGDFFSENGVLLEVIPYSVEKTQAMLSSGDLPDVIIFNNTTDALAALDAGMLLKLEDHLDKLPSIAEDDLFASALKYSRELYSNDTGDLYFVPWGVGNNSLAASPDSERYAIKFNYPVYEQIGAPAFDKLEDVIPILQKMKEVYPKNEEGVAAYGMSLFSDYDTTFFYNMIGTFSLIGYDWNYLKYGIEYDIASDAGYSIFRDGSVYKRSAKFMYEMNQAGLLDPDSLTQDRTTVNDKMNTKAALAGWAAAPAWESKGFYPVSFGEYQPSLTYSNPYGNIGMAVNAKADNVDASLKLIDMLADPEALLTIYNGPQGDRWDFVDGKAVFTDKFKDYYQNGGGTYTLEGGEEFSIFNFVTYVRGTGNVSDTYGEVFPMTLWDEYFSMTYSSEPAKAWTARYGYKYLKEQLEAENRLTAVMDPTFPPFLTTDSDDLKLTLAALKEVIVPSTWELIYAKNEAEFESVWTSMQAKCEALGIQKIIDDKLADIANAQEIAKTFQ